MSKIIPEVYVFNPDKRSCYGAVRMITEFTEDVRFNSCSEINFKVAEKVLDPLTGNYVENPIYSKIEKNNLLYVCDDTEYYSFPNRTLRNDYSIKNISNFSADYGRRTDNGRVQMTYENKKDDGNNNGVLTGFEIQPETHLYNISIAQGYNWENLTDMDELGMRKLSSWSSNYYKVGCLNFIPIEPYDIISIRTKYRKGYNGSDSLRFNNYTLAFYTDADPNTYVGEIKIEYSNPHDANHSTLADPVVRFSINSLKVSDNLKLFRGNYADSTTLSQFKKAMESGGYFRVVSENNHPSRASTSINEARANASYYYTSNGVTNMGWSFPYDGWLQIYSGKRFCSVIDNAITDGYYSLPLHWFVINGTTDETDGIQRYKSVRAYSYEYTLSNKTVSFSEDTLPFYIPPQIIDIINSDNWVIDKEYGLDGSTARAGKQYMSEGLLNQILKAIPDWSVGHISSSLMTRYRKVSDTDNANLYSYMMNDVESLYQCFFVFDNDNKVISAYTQEDIIGNSDIILNWQNALKNLQVTDKDTNFLTALRIHTSDNAYGAGLVNATGSSIIYNFSSVLDELDFVADNSNNDPLNRNKVEQNNTTRNRTLREAVVALMDYIEAPSTTVTLSLCTSVGDGDSPNTTDSDVDNVEGHDNEYTSTVLSISDASDYRDLAVKFVETNMNLLKCQVSVSTYFTNYKSILDKIAVQAGARQQTSFYRNESVMTPFYIYKTWINTGGGDNPFVTDELYNELRNTSKQYYQAKMEYEAKLNDYNSYFGALKEISKRTNLNYFNQLSLTEQYMQNNGMDSNGEPIILSILTPAEILALQPYIREGDWTNSGVVFSEQYDSKDIISTLSDMYGQAKDDMDSFISKPNYDFELDMINWVALSEMHTNYNKLKVGRTLLINTIGDNYIMPILLELHINYKDDDDFKMTFTTDYNRKPLQFRFADLYGTITQTSVTDSTFTFNE